MSVATGSQTVGPFFSFGLSTNTALGCLAGPEARGDRIRLQIRVLDGASAPVPDALVEIWQPDAEGRYDASPDFRGFGRLGTNAAGECVFETVRPGVPPAARAVEAAHINVCLFMRGLLRHVYTRIYFAGDAARQGDATLRLVPGDRRTTLLAQPAAVAGSDWIFEIRLQGDRETVFFDV